ncbi:MAG: 4'-phosphopantetheinyl transferase superfamily protein [Bacilli bacterium]|nr:4'-phosphopantetheinyl transferase superfamily protein [Bacilli bacterium]
MIGIDIVDLTRIVDDYDKIGDRILSTNEKKQMLTYESKLSKISYVGGRFAAKEAYVKASGDKTVIFKNVEVIDDKNGKPHIYINAREVGEVSIAHDGYAIAVVNLYEENK